MSRTDRAEPIKTDSQANTQTAAPPPQSTSGQRPAEDASAARSAHPEPDADVTHPETTQTIAEALRTDPAVNAPTAARMPPGFIRQYELVERVRDYAPEADEDLLNRAYVFSMQAHGHQTRKSGDPYFTHPLAVAAILTELKADPASVVTALLHDTVEDTDTTLGDIETHFGSEIACLVDGVTKLSLMELRSDETKQAENFRKLVMAMADDVRVLLVKLADRLHNMRTLHYFGNPVKQKRIARETLEIYAPLAGRIGIQRFRDELEDLAFRELHPEGFETLERRLQKLQATTVKGVVELSQILRERLEASGIACEVTSREKRPYSIWRKMEVKNLSFEDLADIYAFRVIVETVEDCYRALGLIHTRWRMIPEEFDDYISAPKPNNYQSVHTAVIGPPTEEGGRQRIEIQIRTHRMHDHAERGAAAHWRYKDPGHGREAFDLPSKIDLVSAPGFDFYRTPKSLETIFQNDDPAEALENAKLELFTDQVFCFTPKGSVIALPKGATAIDFAYAVHTDIGDTTIGVQINGRNRPLRTPLTNGDVVKILRAPSARPPEEWESIAVTGRARSAIRRRLKALAYSDQVAIGRNMAEQVFSGARLNFSLKAIKNALNRLGMKSPNDVLARIGRGDLAVRDLIEAVYPGAASQISEHEIRAANAGEIIKPRTLVNGIPHGFHGDFGRCCLPIPGERIVGIVDTENHVCVHTIFCAMLAREDPPQDRWIDLKWRKCPESFRAASRITMTLYNAVGTLSEIANIIARYNVPITNISFANRTPDFFDLIIDVGVKDIENMTQLLTALRATETTISVDRYEADEDA